LEPVIKRISTPPDAYLSEHVTTSAGVQMPRLLFKLEPGGEPSRWEGLVLNAVRDGYEGIDIAGWPAQVSHKPGISTAFASLFASGNVARASLFIQTKIIPHYAAKLYPGVPIRKQVELSIADSLCNLGLEYIDSLLLGSPYPEHEQTLEAWRAMEDAVRAGLVRQLGIASFPMHKLISLNADATLKPAVVYQRVPGWRQLSTTRLMRAWCNRAGVIFQPTGMPYFNFQSVVSKAMIDLAAKYGVSSPMVYFRYVLGLGVVPLISSNDSHKKEYLSAARAPLMAEDADIIGELLKWLRKEKENDEMVEKQRAEEERQEPSAAPLPIFTATSRSLRVLRRPRPDLQQRHRSSKSGTHKPLHRQ
jgi:diketogulonate reductase-like aldo/keto reductase